ncbi:hypothetical protein BDZ89DRAFT_1072003, partial [Hymenopellis radicata]
RPRQSPPAANPSGYSPAFHGGYQAFPNSPPNGSGPGYFPTGLQYTPSHTRYPDTTDNSPQPAAFAPPVAGPASPQPPASSPWGMPPQLPNAFASPYGAPPGWLPQQQGGYPQHPGGYPQQQQQGGYPQQSPFQPAPAQFASPYAPQASPWGNFGAGGLPGTPAGGMGGQLPGGYPPPGGLPAGFVPNGGIGGIGGQYTPFTPGHLGMGMGGGVLPPSLAGFSPAPLGGIGGMNMGTPMGMGMGMGMPPPQGPPPMGMGGPPAFGGGNPLDAATRNFAQSAMEYMQAQQMAQAAAAQPPPAPEMPMGRGRVGDRMPRFTAGSHYAPVLEPFLIHRLNAPYLKWDLRHPTNTCQSSKDRGNVSWSSGRDEPATFRGRRLVPFMITVPARDRKVGVTCGEVIEHISIYMHRRIAKEEFASLPPALRDPAGKSYYHNRSTRPGAPGGALGQGMLKMDLLCNRTHFGGIQENERVVMERYHTSHPCTFELVCLEWPMTREEADELAARGAQADAQQRAHERLMENASLGGRPRSSSTRSRHSRRPSAASVHDEPSGSDRTPSSTARRA